MKIKYLFIAFVCLVLSGTQSCSDSQASPLKSDMVAKVEPAVKFISVPKPVAIRKYDKAILPKVEMVLQHLERDDVLYEWYDYSSCNVGLFAQLCTNSTTHELKNRVDYEYKDFIEYAKRNKDLSGVVMSWKNMTAYYCGISGKPVLGIIGDLQKAGFSSFDIANLEYLSDPYILSRTDIEQGAEFYTKRENVIKYLGAWAEIVRKQ